jgi:hypothetical protein
MLDAFSPDYPTARDRFRQAASRLGWLLEAHPINAAGPKGEELTIDVASSSTGDPERVLVVSSGIHGVEGFFGSAVQIAQLETWAATESPSTKCLFIHGLNPFGFAWLRRVDECNVDPNRNFLLPGEHFEGASEHYARLDPFLNLRQPPGRWDIFTLRALPLIARRGVPALRQAIAEGQYSHPRGLFYGGSGPSQMQQVLREHLPRWLAGSRSVVHLDFHTGLGRRAECQLFVDSSIDGRKGRGLVDWLGPEAFAARDTSAIPYEARGGFGRWCVEHNFAPNYLFAVAEFGTYDSLRVLAGLRAENQAHHWGDPDAPSTQRAKQRLKELFCPADDGWRSRALQTSLELVSEAQRRMER